MVADADVRSLLDMVQIEAKAEEMYEGTLDTATLVAIRLLVEARKAGLSTMADIISKLQE